MKTNNNRRGVIVGIFILLGLVIFIAGILTLGGQKKTFERKLSVKAMFHDVNGLQAGNNVWYLGVKVGTVKKLNFTPNAGVEVLMNIENAAQPFIKNDAKVKVSSEGFIGNKIVVITGGTNTAPSIKEDDVLLVESGLNTDEILATFQQNNKNLVDITSNIKELSERLTKGQGTLGKLLTDETIANQLTVTANGLRQAAANAQRLTENISSYTAGLQRPGTLANDLVTDTVIFNRLRSTAAQLQQVSMTANEVSNNINAASANIKEVSSNLNSSRSPVGVLLNDQQAGNDLKVTLSNLQSGTAKLDQDLEALQHNFLLRGFFKKKERAEKEAAKDSAKAAKKIND
jgi:phospholipid/cholesterol/gamma-HCH transport system substrate-binding protein